MFNGKEIKNSPLTANLELGFEPTKGFTWKELATRGVVRETIEIQDDIVTIKKDFISFDKTYKKSEEIHMGKKEWNIIKAGQMSKEQILNRIEKLKKEMAKKSDNQEYEECSKIRDEIISLTKILAF